ncbi:MAG: hypothetical protein OEM02_09695 [Desulfobulbaceae bacterium]|nr:hypothetical protein [Desulfobulbaceae bacterium]
MKKVIATAAGLMLVGAMAGSAVAELNITGDARARFINRDNYDLNADVDDDNASVESRIRLMLDGKYENAFAHARIKIGDGTWNGAQSGVGTGSDVKSDYAYLGLKLDKVTVTMGRQIANFGHKFFVWDARKDRLKAVLKASDSTTLVGFYDKGLEVHQAADETPEAAAAAAALNAQDKDVNVYGAAVVQKFGDNVNAKLLVISKDDENNDDKDGMGATLAFTANAGVTIVGEVSYKEGKLIGKTDDATGGFVAAVVKSGNMTIVLPAAMTQDGYVADGDFQPTYLYGTQNNPLGALNFGVGGDTFAVAPSVDVKVSDNLTLHGAVAYADIDGFATVTEIDAALMYNLSDKTHVHLKAAHGMLDGANDTELDDLTGAFVEVQTKF